MSEKKIIEKKRKIKGDKNVKRKGSVKNADEENDRKGETCECAFQEEKKKQLKEK